MGSRKQRARGDVRCDVRHLWAEIDGVVCYAGNPHPCMPLRLHAAYMHTSAGSLGTEPLAHRLPEPWE